MTRWAVVAVGLLGIAAVTGCGGDDDAPESAVEEAGAGAAPGMEGMPMEGMGGMEMGGGMMAEMRAHMQGTESQSDDQLQANLSSHRQMVANMISQMNREMRDMGMTGDESWGSTIDSVRQDLRALPAMDAQELQSFMPEHRRRVMLLLDMHQSMMGDMQM